MDNKTAATSTTLTYRRDHPGGGALGRVSYGLAGVPGIVVFDRGMFPDGIVPKTITIDCAMVAPKQRAVAGVTSAVVAATNTAVAQTTDQPIASPATVAAKASAVGGKLKASAERKARTA